MDINLEIGFFYGSTSVASSFRQANDREGDAFHFVSLFFQTRTTAILTNHLVHLNHLSICNFTFAYNATLSDVPAILALSVCLAGIGG